MKKKKEDNLYELYFYTHMPKIHLEYENKEELLKKAYFSHNDKNDCEYCYNTTTWD